MKRIAVCLSGQPRTVQYCTESLLNYFSNQEGSNDYQFDFFCHSWTHNEYKIKIEGKTGLVYSREVISAQQVEEQLARFNPRKVVIDTEILNEAPWKSLFYSVYIANHLKKQYEIENDFRYDFVIKSRYDLIYPEHMRFKLDYRTDNLHVYYSPLDLFCAHQGRSFHEYQHVNVSDVTYYGSSWVMDVLADAFWSSFNYNELDDCNYYGPGTLISYYSHQYNLRFHQCYNLSRCQEIVYRKEAIPLDWRTDYREIVELNNSIYT